MPPASKLFGRVLPLRRSRWVGVAALVIIGVAWLANDSPAWAAGAGLLAGVVATIGKKFELDAERRRYRVGRHWLNVLNPAWQPLPPIQHVVMKPCSYQQTRRSSLAAVAHDSRWQGFTVLLSVPNSVRGIVVLSTDDE